MATNRTIRVARSRVPPPPAAVQPGRQHTSKAPASGSERWQPFSSILVVKRSDGEQAAIKGAVAGGARHQNKHGVGGRPEGIAGHSYADT